MLSGVNTVWPKYPDDTLQHVALVTSEWDVAIYI